MITDAAQTTNPVLQDPGPSLPGCSRHLQVQGLGALRYQVAGAAGDGGEFACDGTITSSRPSEHKAYVRVIMQTGGTLKGLAATPRAVDPANASRFTWPPMLRDRSSYACCSNSTKLRSIGDLRHAAINNQNLRYVWEGSYEVRLPTFADLN